ncbi:aminotransferase class I/II-fold pyridoxal phosphate-dependent enzyme [Microbacterium sp.]|uniref:MalY/PatB family protein n=1 Tax=Microbacterium sp. TaxID=51671 RepID=UPI002810B1D1|nr:aminotransferase class I/II-fold pyridoxal phosphate-dependent enzyme [Microbacterium sp.]
MNLEQRMDAVTVEQLHARGGLKWSDPQAPIGAFVAEMDFGVAPPITAALHAAVDEGAFGYAPPRLWDELRSATAGRLRSRHGWSIEADQVFPVPDVIKALEVAIEHFSAPGSKVIVPTPSYMPFLTVPGILGREVIEVPMILSEGVWRFDLDGIQRAFDDGGECFVLCNPYNPLGRVFDREELTALSAVIERNHGRVFSDEIWAPLVFPGRELISYATLSDETAGHTITATSASKAFNLPGLKCAQLIVSNDADKARLAEHGMWIGHGTANLGVIANTVAYRDGQPWLDEVVDYLQQNRDELVRLVGEHLPDVTVTVPEGTYVGWLDFSATGIDRPAQFFREHAGVGLTDGTACGAAGAGHARFIFAMPRPVLREAIIRMGEAVRAQA